MVSFPSISLTVSGDNAYLHKINNTICDKITQQTLFEAILKLYVAGE